LVLTWLIVAAGTAVPGASDPAHSGKIETPTKVSADLIQLYDEYAARGGGLLEPRDTLIPIAGDRVTIDAVAVDDVNALKSDLEALGMQNAVAFGRVVSGQLPIRSIGALDALASLKFARPAYATTNPGPVSPGFPPPPLAPPPGQPPGVR